MAGERVNVDQIFGALNEQDVDYILIGGMNFLLRHAPELTFDVDLWVADTPDNLAKLNSALRSLGAEWGPTEHEWRPVPDDWRWLQAQVLFCLTTAYGAVDVFRDVRGLERRYKECRERAVQSTTATGAPYLALADRDMLSCQEALPEGERKLKRMETLRAAIRKSEAS